MVNRWDVSTRTHHRQQALKLRDKVRTYLQLAEKLAEFAKTLKYTSVVDRAVDNEKYAFRCFLLRLGFISKEYKTECKLLLAPMEGNGAYKAKNTEVEVITI